MVTTNTKAWELIEEHLLPISSLLEDEEVSEIYIDRYNSISARVNGTLQHFTELKFGDHDSLQYAFSRVASICGQSFDESSPMMDAIIHDGSRISATHPPLTQSVQATIRCHSKKVFSMDDLLENKTLSQIHHDYIIDAVTIGKSGLFCGPTYSGKSTLLRAAAQHIPQPSQVWTVEDTRELNLDLEHGVEIIIPPYSMREENKQTMAGSIKHALRNNPDRLIVGEIRDADALTALLEGIEVGFRGCLSTIHAHSAHGAISRMARMLYRASNSTGIDLYEHMIRDTIDFIAYCELNRKTQRYEVREVIELSEKDTKAIT